MAEGSKLLQLVWDSAAPEKRSQGLPPGGDGPTFGDMEARVAKLEASVSHIERDIGEVRADIRDLRTEFKSFRDVMSDTRERLARLEERVAHLPGKGFIVTCTTVTLGLMVTLATLAPKLQSLFGITAP